MQSNKQIKVLHFYKTHFSSEASGVATTIDSICNSIAKYGVQSKLLSLAKSPEKEPIKFAHYEEIQAKQNLFVASTGFSLQAFKMFKQLASEADIIHHHFPNPFADMLHFGCRINKPAIVTYHSDIVKQKKVMLAYKPLMNKFLNAMQKVVTTSPNYLATSPVLQQLPKEKVEVIPIGIPDSIYTNIDQSRVEHWRNILPDNFFLFVGALRYYKGVSFALQAAKLNNIPLVLAGCGDMEDELKQYAKQHNLSNVYFLGSVSEADKKALLHLCYAFIFPSHLRSEAFGIALVEASAHGKAMISCEIGSGTTFINLDQQTGIAVPPCDPEAIDKAMRYLIENPDKNAEFGHNAKQRFIELFTADKQAESYYNIYKEVLYKNKTNK